MPTHRKILEAQRKHWQATFGANPDMYGTEPSQPGRYAAELFTQHHIGKVLELGAGQGPDTLASLRAGLEVTALDYAPEALASLRGQPPQPGWPIGCSPWSTTCANRSPFRASVDTAYSRMLFNMALSTAKLITLGGEVRRAIRPDGLHVYTVRHTGDAHYGIGTTTVTAPRLTR